MSDITLKEALRILKDIVNENTYGWDVERECLEVIEQELNQKEKQDKVLKILKRASKEERVFEVFPYCDSYYIEDGSDGYRSMELTEEEYNLLNQWMDNDKEIK